MDHSRPGRGSSGNSGNNHPVPGLRTGSSVGLIEEPTKAQVPEQPGAQFGVQLQKTLLETQDAVLQLGLSPIEILSWQVAREITESFKPVPWFIWRISNFVFGSTGKPKPISEGLVFGLRRLLFACASDSILGKGEKVNSVRVALATVSPDVIAAVAVVHAVCRKISSYGNERIWRPILDDAMLRARIGYMLGGRNPSFGAGRGILAGFASRAGLAILIANGEAELAPKALELLATGKDISLVGLEVYGCDPMQISAMVLSAAGCGRDAAFGTVAYAAQNHAEPKQMSDEQTQWLSAYTLVEGARTGDAMQVPDDCWELFYLASEQARESLLKEIKKIVRQGHGWNWIV